ncbi:MAG: aldehyde dehydrogenase family protein, partial [Maritimibacter sp.]
MLDLSRIETLRSAPVPPALHVIDGARRPASDGGVLEVISPLNGEVLTTMAAGTKADADAAIAAARRAFDDGRWADLAPASRKKILLRWADLIEENALELAVLGVRNNGTEIGMALKAEPLSAAGTIRYYAEALDKLYGEIAPTDPGTLGLIHRAPVGVVGAIVPWNFPLMIGSWTFAPALAAGNTVVLKPAETASLTLVRLAELWLEAGLPAGVFNVVTGRGAVVGEAMGLSMDVDVLVFTGSGPVGRRLLEYSARSNLKLMETVKVSANGIFRNAGQVCVAGSRLLVERSIHDEFVEALSAYVEGMKTGDPLDPATASGAVNSLAQLQQNLGFVDEARALGRDIRIGGQRVLEETGGYYMAPTIVAGVSPDDRLAREEVFGPVLAVIAFDSEDEAISIANSTDYGLASAVWTRDLS